MFHNYYDIQHYFLIISYKGSIDTMTIKLIKYFELFKLEAEVTR